MRARGQGPFTLALEPTLSRACRGGGSYNPVVGKKTAQTVAIWLGSLLVLPVLFVLAYLVAEIQVTLLVFGILAAMVLAYHGTAPVAAFFPGDPPHSLVWFLLFLMFISPAVGWFVHRVRKEDLEAKEREERLRQCRERRKRDGGLR